MDHSIHPTALRLVGDDASDAGARGEEAHRFAIEDENRAASSLGAGDMTRLFAMQVSESLEGGRSAVLTPNKRRGLLKVGHRLGVRDFDANLVIAIVQDGARRGENVHTNMTRQRLRFLSASRSVRAPDSRVRMVVIAGAIALGAVVALISWVTSG